MLKTPKLDQYAIIYPKEIGIRPITKRVLVARILKNPINHLFD